MRGKAVLTFAVLAAGGALMVSGTASAGGGAETKVTIKAPGGDVFGKVKSPKARCVEDRVVKVYRVKGGSPGGGDDIKVGTDGADADGDWSVGQPGVSGKRIYAKVAKIQGCQKDRSKVIKAG